MKHIGPILAVGFTLVVLAVVAVFSLIPQASSAESEPVAAASAVEVPAMAASNSGISNEAQLQEHEAALMTQINQLNAWFTERQTAYQTQAQELSAQIEAGQAQLEVLDQQQNQLVEQLNELRQLRKQRNTTYQIQLQEVASQYDARRAELQQRLQDAQAKLVEANQQLGR